MFPALVPYLRHVYTHACSGKVADRDSIRWGQGKGKGVTAAGTDTADTLEILDTEIRRQDKRTRKSCVRHLVRREPAAASYVRRCRLKVFQGGCGA